jgi:cytochrome d ubiquinol oxidase subunit I
MVVELMLMVKFVRAGVAGVMPELAAGHDDKPGDGTKTDDDVLAFAY